jgi:hypothetical protein
MPRSPEQNTVGTETRLVDGREERIGRDPRNLTQDELRVLGHEQMSATAAVRARCLDCCAGQPGEVRACMALSCPSWPWRMGSNPWRAPVSEQRREAGRRIMAQLHARRQNPGTEPGPGGETTPAATPVPAEAGAAE